MSERGRRMQGTEGVTADGGKKTIGRAELNRVVELGKSYHARLGRPFILSTTVNSLTRPSMKKIIPTIG